VRGKSGNLDQHLLEARGWPSEVDDLQHIEPP